jgi:hypothetical protein
MSRSAKFFRYLWRLNAILILVAAGAIAFAVATLLVAEWDASAGRQREAAAGPLAGSVESTEDVVLGRAEVVAGTNIIRADLISHQGGAGFSSGGYSESRNTLFMEPGAKEARWLLPDDDHVIVQSSDIASRAEEGKQPRTVATAALVKTRGGNRETATGRLLLFDAGAKNVVEVASNIRALHSATFGDGAIRLLYEREQRLVLATFDPISLEKRSEEALTIPLLR